MTNWQNLGNQQSAVDFSDEASYADYEKVRQDVKDAVSSLEYFHKKITSATAKSITIDGLKYVIQKNFTENFQVSNFSELENIKNESLNISIENTAKIQIKNNNIELSIDSIGTQILEKYSRVIYLESQAYWKLKNALRRLILVKRVFVATEDGSAEFRDISMIW